MNTYHFDTTARHLGRYLIMRKDNSGHYVKFPEFDSSLLLTKKFYTFLMDALSHRYQDRETEEYVSPVSGQRIRVYIARGTTYIHLCEQGATYTFAPAYHQNDREQELTVQLGGGHAHFKYGDREGTSMRLETYLEVYDFLNEATAKKVTFNYKKFAVKRHHSRIFFFYDEEPIFSLSYAGVKGFPHPDEFLWKEVGGIVLKECPDGSVLISTHVAPKEGRIVLKMPPERREKCAQRILEEQTLRIYDYEYPLTKWQARQLLYFIHPTTLLLEEDDEVERTEHLPFSRNTHLHLKGLTFYDHMVVVDNKTHVYSVTLTKWQAKKLIKQLACKEGSEAVYGQLRVSVFKDPYYDNPNNDDPVSMEIASNGDMGLTEENVVQVINHLKTMLASPQSEVTPDD